MLTPLFMGSEPVIAEDGKYAGTSILQAEQDLALKVIRSLDPAQRGQAILYESILSGTLPPERGRGPDGRIKGAAFTDNLVLPYEGIRASELSTGSQELLLALTRLYTHRLRDGHAELWRDAVAQHLNETRLMWMGSTRTTASSTTASTARSSLIEFDHQSGVAFDNTSRCAATSTRWCARRTATTMARTCCASYAKYAHVNGEHVAR